MDAILLTFDLVDLVVPAGQELVDIAAPVEGQYPDHRGLRHQDPWHQDPYRQDPYHQEGSKVAACHHILASQDSLQGVVAAATAAVAGSGLMTVAAGNQHRTVGNLESAESALVEEQN